MTNTTIEVFGNAGRLTVDAVTGLVLDYDKDEEERVGEWSEGYGAIARFDLEEWRRFYKDEELCGGDICDWSYWLRDGTYQEAEEDWRNDFHEERRESEEYRTEQAVLSKGSGI